MNEQELERRFRSLTEGPQPDAPRSLRQFLHELPETRQAPRVVGLRLPWRGPAHRSLVGILGISGGLAFAVVVGLLVGDLLLTIRGQTPVAAAPTVGVHHPQPVPAFTAGGFTWIGDLDTDAIGPRVALADGRGGYLGVGPSGRGAGVLLASADAVHWSEKQTDAIDPTTVDLKSIARGAKGFVAVGSTIQRDHAATAGGSSAEPPMATPGTKARSTTA